MGFVIFIVFLAIVGVSLWSASAVLFGRHTTLPLRICYSLLLLAALVGTFLTTYRYDYYANADTHYYGWPVPTVIFQRHDANSPWLDFVGWPTFFAYPINLALYLCLPSGIFLAIIFLRARRRP